MENNLQLLECNEDDIIGFKENFFKISRLMKAVAKSSNQELGSKFIDLLVSNGLFFLIKII